MDAAWTSPQAVTGLRSPGIVPHVAPVTAQAAVGHGVGGPLSSRNPLTWAVGILAVTLGLAAMSGSVRLGKAQVSASVGRSGS